ncbi:hypothetical protein MBT84_21950 [Streptomyces sp. MBT84]|nr:hypothetical protein [Streptomyces sp. MBT84]
MPRDTLPEPGVVPVDHRPGPSGAGTAGGGGVLEDPEPVDAHRLTRHPYVHPRRDEVTGAELRPLPVRDRLDHRVERDLVPGPQRTQVLLLAVGGDDGGAAGLVEQSEQLVERLRAPRVAGEAAHRPHLEHGGRGDRVRTGVGGVGVAHHLAPVPDHRRVDRIPADARDGGGRPVYVLRRAAGSCSAVVERTETSSSPPAVTAALLAFRTAASRRYPAAPRRSSA